jgi:hypothetical protein
MHLSPHSSPYDHPPLKTAARNWLSSSRTDSTATCALQHGEGGNGEAGGGVGLQMCVYFVGGGGAGRGGGSGEEEALPHGRNCLSSSHTDSTATCALHSRKSEEWGIGKVGEVLL